MTGQYEKAADFLGRLISKSYLTKFEQYAIIKGLNINDYKEFISMYRNCSIDTLVLGNLDPPHSLLKLYDFYFKKTHTNKLYKHSLGITGYNIYTAPTINENAIFNWYEFGKYDPKIYAALQVFKIITSDQAFRYLRSQAQLGYTIGINNYDGYLTNGFYLIVQGSVYNPAEMQEVINQFWNSVNISESDVDAAKKAIKSTEDSSNNYEDLLDEIWTEILIGRFGFTESKNQLDELENIFYSDILSILQDIQNHTNELSIRMYVDMNESTENSIPLDYFKKSQQK